MRVSIAPLASAALALTLGSAVPAVAQSGNDNMPSVEIELTSVALGIGGQSGDGVLTLPNLGTNCVYPFEIEGFGGGLQVGVSQMLAFGKVQGLTSVAAFPGEYTSTEGESTLIAGGGALRLVNDANENVFMELKSRTEGLNVGVGAKGLTIALVNPPQDGPRTQVLEFGYNKHWVSADSEAKLRQVVDAWKCRYVNFEVVGHSDTSGDEGYNVELSDKRAKTVRDFMVGAGINRDRISTRAAGEDEPLVDTGDAERERANRAVVVNVTPMQ